MHILQTIVQVVIPFLVILSLLVFVHELGHFWAARKNGVKVEVFSIGFGREIFGWNDAKGTRWKISWLPLGGYVRMFSDLNAASQPDQNHIAQMTEEEKQQSLFHKSVWQRISVSAAGPLANYLFSLILMTGLYIFVGQRIPTEIAKIGQVMPESAAALAGLKSDDVVQQINEHPIASFNDMYLLVRENPGKELTFIVSRENQPLTLKVIPQEAKEESLSVGRLGVTHGTIDVKHPFYSAPFYALGDCLSFTWQALISVGHILTGKKSTEGLSGPIGIATMTGEIMQKEFTDVLWFCIFLSLNLGFLNLLPIPMFDGGHLLFYFIEAIRGKPVSEKAQEIAYRIGFTFVIFLVLFSTWNDLSRLKALEFLKNIFG
ncbi:MAG: RIP metalloprotease RseP [Candidatus Paracaedimonas acanthamoebae]|uniref:Zinc metalloprotease n=1 Tax=Candidatus Paracaedimonas acanthamoebae TaxID=244581 RepID=A0A8J7PJZ2_9PROT|nr:RIP metalloprotease RseP [Candidatus Paracaedimonas acanthamoebae]